MQIIAGLLVVLCIAGVAFYLLQHKTPRLQPAPNTRRSEIEREFARVFSMTSALFAGRGLG
ncbi:hypothetical protein [Bradyrhizobium lablabi]|uniref:hypothetical protein n=1 Tax=Bradyrhizobium lablabi TaxID=722472 RepID=UPI0015619DA4|nr:hypothetical protein [Bradyrhizobium lablabi]